MQTTRRDVLKGLGLGLGAACAGGLFMPGLSKLAFAAGGEAGGPILIVLHLRGGCDGLNLISPASDPDFIAARASELRVAAEGQDAGYALANGPVNNIDFRLHKSAGGLNELYKGGQLAFIHACGLMDSTRSHFVATDMIERGVGTEADLMHAENGWITRRLEAQKRAAALRAVAAAGSIAGDLEGFSTALAVPQLNDGLPFIGGAPVANALWAMYGNDKSPIGAAGRLALQLPAGIDSRVPRDPSGRAVPYKPSNNVNYDSAQELAQPFKTIAQLIRMNLGLEAATLDFGGFDTHEYQANRFRPLVEKLSNGISAFWNDMSDYHDRIVLVTLTEFGRRLRSNASNGTDHGRAGVMMVLGGKVGGGRFYGGWPGLTSQQLDEGVDLAVTTDYRRVLAEVLDHQGAGGAAKLFPNYKPEAPLGLFRA